MTVNASDLKKGAKIRLVNGKVLVVRGCYMSPDGIVVTAKEGGQLVDQNVPLRDVQELVKEGA